MPPSKHAAKHAPMHDAAKDLRRAYEHLGRLEAIAQQVHGSSSERIMCLVDLAKTYLTADMPKHAADLLRAAEHLSFSALPSFMEPETTIAPELANTLTEEFEKLVLRASDHLADHDGEHSAFIVTTFKAASNEAASAFATRRFRQALELSRAAEALAHVHKQPHAVKPLRLKAS